MEDRTIGPIGPIRRIGPIVLRGALNIGIIGPIGPIGPIQVLLSFLSLTVEPFRESAFLKKSSFQVPQLLIQQIIGLMN